MCMLLLMLALTTGLTTVQILYRYVRTVSFSAMILVTTCPRFPDCGENKLVIIVG